jgi:hypothetical protein
VALMSTRACLALCLFCAAALPSVAMAQAKRTWIDPPASLDSPSTPAVSASNHVPWPDEASRRLPPKSQVAHNTAPEAPAAPAQTVLASASESEKRFLRKDASSPAKRTTRASLNSVARAEAKEPQEPEATASIDPPQRPLVRKPLKEAERAKPVQASIESATAPQPRPAERIATRREHPSKQRRRVVTVSEQPVEEAETASTPSVEARVVEADQPTARFSRGSSNRAAPIIGESVFRGD